MRFILIHKTNAYYEADGLPSRDLIARVGALLGDLKKAGALQTGEGLRATAHGVRLTVSAGARTIVPGPFEGGNELPAGFSILRTRSIEDAIEWATRQADALGPAEDVEFDIRPVTEPWDIGMGSKPADLTTERFMVLRKATPGTESGATPSAEQRTKLSQLIEETTKTGVHLATESMQPSRRGRRYKNSVDGVSAYDGPFLETKELIAGYMIVTADSIDDAGRWAERYIKAVDADEVDVRELEPASARQTR